MAKTNTTKPANKGNRKNVPAVPPPAEAGRENRYLRAARIIIAEGEGIDLAELAVKATMSTSTAGHCREAFKGVSHMSQALREASLLLAKASDVAVVMPEGGASATQAEPAAA